MSNVSGSERMIADSSFASRYMMSLNKMYLGVFCDFLIWMYKNLRIGNSKHTIGNIDGKYWLCTERFHHSWWWWFFLGIVIVFGYIIKLKNIHVWTILAVSPLFYLKFDIILGSCKGVRILNKWLRRFWLLISKYWRCSSVN